MEKYKQHNYFISCQAARLQSQENVNFIISDLAENGRKSLGDFEGKEPPAPSQALGGEEKPVGWAGWPMASMMMTQCEEGRTDG